MLFEAANKASFITGGVDGLSGMMVGKLFGVFEFDLYGNVAFWYSFGVLFVLFVVLRRLVNRRSACRLRGIREGGRRMPALGVNVNRRLVAIFTLAARRWPAWPVRCWRRPRSSSASTCWASRVRRS
jgi:branched-chain amino acid transport system permease protein